MISDLQNYCIVNRKPEGITIRNIKTNETTFLYNEDMVNFGIIKGNIKEVKKSKAIHYNKSYNKSDISSNWRKETV